MAGDGGVAWLRKAVQRCEEQAAERGVSVDEVAAERYGVAARCVVCFCSTTMFVGLHVHVVTVEDR